ncbi:guanine nucleotide-binding protein G(I)/G(S)/G(O) subunit gamma-T2 isoform 1-T1 [Glossophaga mutica]
MLIPGQEEVRPCSLGLRLSVPCPEEGGSQWALWGPSPPIPPSRGSQGLERWSLQGGMAQELSEKELLRMEVEQLKTEVRNSRAPISKTGKEIKEYVEAQAGNDPLLKGIPEDKNPFKEKGACRIS